MRPHQLILASVIVTVLAVPERARGGHGCAEKPWVRVAVRQRQTATRTALVATAHIGPVGRAFQRRSIHGDGRARCPDRRYRHYYSDHPIVRAVVG